MHVKTAMKLFSYHIVFSISSNILYQAMNHFFLAYVSSVPKISLKEKKNFVGVIQTIVFTQIYVFYVVFTKARCWSTFCYMAYIYVTQYKNTHGKA